MMSILKRAILPEAHEELFDGAICHPELWLWDSWMAVGEDGSWHLYCLAINRFAADGRATTPSERNDYPFQIRHFSSANKGQSWKDEGLFQRPGQMADGADSRNIWSGSVSCLGPNMWIFPFTAIRELGPERPFLQSLCVAWGAGPDYPDNIGQRALLCPLRDYDLISKAGYYLGPPDELGSSAGEENGPILAWRDPYLFEDKSGALHLFWSAKIGPKNPCVGHARVAYNALSGLTLLSLEPPILLPDAETCTQAEVPKIYYDEGLGQYILLISACDRLFEGQSDDDVTKVLRLYKGPSAKGPWAAYRDGSLLAETTHFFGASLTNVDNGRFTLIAPITEMASREVQLSFAAPIEMKYQ